MNTKPQIKIVSVDDLFEDRLEPEFYTLEKITYQGVSVMKYVESTSYGTSDALNEEREGYPTLRLNEFDRYFIGTPEKYCNSISPEKYQELKVSKNDVFICRTNGNPKYVGKAALSLEDLPYIFASYLFRVRTNKHISASTLVTFLNSKYGRLEIERYSIVGNQANFSPAKFRNIKIPKFSAKVDKIIEEQIAKSFYLTKEAEKHLAAANELFEDELGLNKLNILAGDFSSEGSLSSMQERDRLDADYKLPMYVGQENTILSYSNGSVKLGEAVEISSERKDLIKGDTYKYIELSDIDSNYSIVEPDDIQDTLAEELPSRAQMEVRQSDILVASVAGSCDKVAYIHSSADNLVASTGFHVLRKGIYPSEVLLVIMRSKYMQNMIRRNSRGMILEAVSKSDFSEIVVPILGDKVQKEIKTRAQLAIKKRVKSINLIQLATKTVEIFVEEDEAAAIKYINDNEKSDT